MKSFLKLFDSRLDSLLYPTFYIDCRVNPSLLLKQLRSPHEVKKLIKLLQTNTSDPLKIIKIQSICALLLVYSDDYFTIIQDHLTHKVCKDDWLNKRFIQPFFRFIKKCCASSDQYIKCRNSTIRKNQARQSLFYSIHMLRELFKIVEKMPFLGRYYKPKNQELFTSAIQIIALQAQKIYFCFKQSLHDILSERDFYIKGLQDEKILKGVFGQQLISINEQMKKLFLDKYFYPLGKGIGVKLFRPEEQSVQIEHAIHSIASNHEQTQRRKKHDNLQKTLFPGSGVVNWNFYQQSLIGNPLNITTNGLEKTVYKDLDDLVISEQEEEYEEKVLPIEFKKSKKQGISEKQTNSGEGQAKVQL